MDYLKVRKAKHNICAVFFIVLTIVAIHFLFDAGLSCIDQFGCLRSYCTEDMLSNEYRQAYRDNLLVTNCTYLTN